MGIGDIWGLSLPPHIPQGLGAPPIPPPTGSNVRAGKGSEEATRLPQSSNTFRMGKWGGGTELGPWDVPRKETGSSLGTT